MSVNVTVVNNTARVRLDTTVNAGLFLRFALDEIDSIAFPKTPKKTGELRKDVFKQVLGLRGTIKWIKAYAIWQEVKQFANYTTPGTGPHYAENAVEKFLHNPEPALRKARLL